MCVSRSTAGWGHPTTLHYSTLHAAGPAMNVARRDDEDISVVPDPPHGKEFVLGRFRVAVCGAADVDGEPTSVWCEITRLPCWLARIQCLSG